MKTGKQILARAAFVSCALLIASAASAQPEVSGNGYLFGAPNIRLSIRGGYSGAAAGSDIFSFVTRELSLSKSDFSSTAIAADLAWSIGKRLDLVVSIDADGMEKKSDYREWQDNSGNPIEQTTAFSRTAYTVSARYYLMPQGRSLGRFAWVPARYAPWVSAGVGRISYSLDQHGDFVDFEHNNTVFYDSYKSSQWGNAAQVAAGIDWSVDQRWALTSQARYLFGRADLQKDYVGFDPIDLSGLGISAGITLRF